MSGGEWVAGRVYRFVLKSGKVFIAVVEKVLRGSGGVCGLRLGVLEVVRGPPSMGLGDKRLYWVDTKVIARAEPVTLLEIPEWFFEGGQP